MLYIIKIIIHVIIKGLLKSYNVVQKQSTTVTKVDVAHTYRAFINILDFKFQCG